MHKAPKRRPLSTAAEGSKRGRQLAREPKRCESNCTRERARVCVRVGECVCVLCEAITPNKSFNAFAQVFGRPFWATTTNSPCRRERESECKRELSIGNYSCRREGRKEGDGFAVKSIGLGRIGRAYLSSTAHSLVAAKGNYTT